MDIILGKNERLDDLQINGAKLIQNTQGYNFSSDSVLLANYIKSTKKKIICDLGTGSGVMPIIIAQKKEYKHIYGLEIQKSLYDLAIRNIKLNALDDKVTILNEDIKNNKLPKGSFDIVLTNPPYFKGGTVPQNEEIAIARNEVLATLDDFVRVASELLNFKGAFYIAYKVSRFVDLFECLMKYNLMPKEVVTVQPKGTKEIDLCLVKAIKGGKREMHMKNLIVYNEDNTYTQKLKDIYKT